MPQTLGAFAPERMPEEEGRVFETDVKAGVLSLGGLAVLAVCVVLTGAVVVAPSVVPITGLQSTILAVLALGAWMYFADSVTERLRIVDKAVEFNALLSRHRRVPISELSSFLIHEQGFSLDHGAVLLELNRFKGPSERISLGPCWNREHLENFLSAVDMEMNA